MGILAGTTFADGMLGSIMGIANVISEAAQGNIGSFKDVLY
jgi:hypothetical protein